MAVSGREDFTVSGQFLRLLESREKILLIVITAVSCTFLACILYSFPEFCFFLLNLNVDI